MLDLTEPLVGPGVVLWRSELLHVASTTPSEGIMPWHQDGADPASRPTESLSVRVALDPVDRANGCMRLLPRAHERLVRAIRNARDRAGLALAPDDVDPAITVEGVRASGEVTLYDARTLYCEPVNRSSRRRAAIVFRYRPADAGPAGGASAVARGHGPAA